MDRSPPDDPGVARLATGAQCRRFAKALLVAMVVLLFPVLSIAREEVAVPLRATSLGGVEVTIPGPESAAVLVVGFGRSAGSRVRLWRRHIDGLDTAPSVASVLVIDDMPRILRGTVTRRIRSEVSRERQDTIYVVTEHGDAWRELAQFDESDGADEAHVIRFDGKGQICFRHVGPVTDTAASALLAADCGQAVASGRSETPTD